MESLLSGSPTLIEELTIFYLLCMILSIPFSGLFSKM
jgi:hypothetical protein